MACSSPTSTTGFNELYRELEARGKAAKSSNDANVQGPCRTAGITCPTHNCAPARHQGLSTKSVQHVHGALRAALQDAVRDGLLIRNPADLATPPRRTATQRRVTTGQVWTADQARTFLHQVSDDPLEALWTVALATGLRRAELVGLTWNDINLKNGTLEVTTTTTVVRGREVTSDGKTDAAHRRLSLDDRLVEVLTKHQESRVSKPTSAGHVFTDVDGNPLNPQRLTKHFARLADRLALPKIGGAWAQAHCCHAVSTTAFLSTSSRTDLVTLTPARPCLCTPM